MREPARQLWQARQGFTLMEVLVVVAIIGILGGLLYPVLAEVRARARQTMCLSNLRQLARAHHLYVQDWDEQLPSWMQRASANRATPGWPRYWTTFLVPYLRSRQVVRDPAAGPPPALPGQAMYLSDYVLLTWRWDGDADLPTRPRVRWPGPPLSLGQVLRPAETIQWMEGVTTTHATEGVTRRHGEGVNAVFVDGHARWMPERAFWRVQWDREGYYWLYHGCADR